MEFELETVTPMFMGGADPRQSELRAPSIKGAMRFWWRAMNGHLALDELRRQEAEIFGGSGENQARRSSVSLRITPAVIPAQDKKENLWDELDKISKGKSYKSPSPKSDGIFYLLYSGMMPNQEKAYIRTGFPFKLIFRFDKEENLKHAVAGWWCSVYFGGFGSRARRGGGNLRIISIEDKSNKLKTLLLDFIAKGNTSEEVANWLKANFTVAKNIVNEGKEILSISDYSNLIGSKFIIAQTYKETWIESLNEIGQIFKKFRTGHKSEVYDTAVFGLPILHRNRHITVKGRGKDHNQVFERRSSPLIFKILKVDQNQYYWFVLRLEGEFLPKDSVIKAVGTQEPDYKLLDEFWGKLKNKGKEYSLSEDKEGEIKK